MNKVEILQVVVDGYPLQISRKLVSILQREIDRAKILAGTAAYIHFRDPSYSASAGGFRPVEVFINDTGLIQYLTEFTWVGREPMLDLAKSADFDLCQGVYQDLYACHRLDTKDVKEFWKLWSGNFISYYEMDIYTVEVKEGP
jgi:hypothetical protein